MCNERKISRRIGNQRGYFLAEVLVTLLLLTVLGALLGTYVFCGKLANASANETTAAFLAQKQIACIKGNPVVIQNVTEIPWMDAAEKMPIEKNGVYYAIETTSTKVEGEEYLKNIQVKVKWNEFYGEKDLCIVSLVRTDE